MAKNNIILFILIATYGFVITAKGQKISTISRKVPQHGKEWHYGEKWASVGYPECGKKHQSPIRLVSSNAVENNSLDLKLENYNKQIKLAFIENNGHTVQVGFSDKLRVSIIGSATNNQRYIFEQMHWHWGSYDGVGSEHTIDGVRGPMEIHLVHYKQSYGSFDEAVDKPDGLVVLGAIYKISPRKNQFLSSVIKLVKSVPKYEDKASIRENFTLRSLLPKRLKPFFSYSGSLTCPPCYESVTWIVFKNPVDISSSQEKEFRKCRGENVNYKTGRKKPISNNYRPVQAINNRTIQISS